MNTCVAEKSIVPSDLSEDTFVKMSSFFKQNKILFSGSKAEDCSKRLTVPKEYFYSFTNKNGSVTVILREYKTSRSAYSKPNRFEVLGKTKDVLYSCSFTKFDTDMKNYILKIIGEI